MPRRRGFAGRALTLTPLIDVIFLLLLFFMLTSTFSRYGEIEMTTAAEGGPSTSAPTLRFLQLGRSDLRLAGQAVALGELAPALSGTRTLMSLDADVDAQRLIDVLAALREIPDLRLTVLQ